MALKEVLAPPKYLGEKMSSDLSSKSDASLLLFSCMSTNLIDPVL